MMAECTLTPLTQTVLVVRQECRLCFGPSFADKWGFFVDRNMSTQIHSYLDWIRYPKGDHVLEGHTGWVYCAVISRDGSYLFTGSHDRCIIKWDLRTNEMILKWKSRSRELRSLAHFPGILVSGSFDSEIKVWNERDHSLIRTLRGHTKGVYCLTLNKQGTILVSGSGDETCRVWSMDSGVCSRIMCGHFDIIRTLILCGDVIITGSQDRSLVLWNVDSGKQLRKMRKGIDGWVYSVSMNSDESMLACCYSDGFTVFKYPSMEVSIIRRIDSYCCCFHPSIPTILAVNDQCDHSIQLYRTDTSATIRTLRGHSKAILCLRFSPDGYRLISGSEGNIVRVWDVSDLC